MRCVIAGQLKELRITTIAVLVQHFIIVIVGQLGEKIHEFSLNITASIFAGWFVYCSIRGAGQL